MIYTEPIRTQEELMIVWENVKLGKEVNLGRSE